MKVLRTPDARFDKLAEWPFAPHYEVIDSSEGENLRIAFVDEGPRGASPILLMHGEPSWSYLYRKIIPPLLAHGHRVVAPDLIGFGRSDKPGARTDYTYERHVAWMSQWLAALDLKNITLFCQDWGGLIGLRLVAAFPERFAAVIVANTGLPTGHGMTEGFQRWLDFSQKIPELPIGGILSGGCSRQLTEAERAAYDAPFPDESYKEGARQFPLLVPVTPEHASVAQNRAAWAVLEKFDKPFVTAFSDADPVTKGGDAVFQAARAGRQGARARDAEGRAFSAGRLSRRHRRAD